MQGPERLGQDGEDQRVDVIDTGRLVVPEVAVRKAALEDSLRDRREHRGVGLGKRLHCCPFTQLVHQHGEQSNHDTNDGDKCTQTSSRAPIGSGLWTRNHS